MSEMEVRIVFSDDERERLVDYATERRQTVDKLCKELILTAITPEELE